MLTVITIHEYNLLRVCFLHYLWDSVSDGVSTNHTKIIRQTILNMLKAIYYNSEGFTIEAIFRY